MAIRVSLLKDCKILRNGYACNLRFQKVNNRSVLSAPVRFISIRNIVNTVSKNRNDKLRPLFNQCSNIQRGHSTYMAELLADRAIIRVSGVEAAIFLQGLITNDIDHLLDNGNNGILLFTPPSSSKLAVSNEGIDIARPLLYRSIYTMFLNTSGRVLFDVIITRPSEDCFVLDCSADNASKLIKHLKMYRVRKKIDLSIEDKTNIWTVFCKDILQPRDLSNRSMAEDFIRLGLSPDGVISTIDPRLKQLGYRIAVFDHECATAKKLMSMKQASPNDYKELRLRLGVGECSSELQTSKALPLESNVDYLHGVSFHKGCYIGQELTARTHHTGVVRKRIMPLIVDNPQGVSLQTELNIEIEKSKKSVGKLKNIINNYGIGLMRIEDCLKAQNNDEAIVISDHPDVTVKVLKPDWWPEISQNKLIDK